MAGTDRANIKFTVESELGSFIPLIRSFPYIRKGYLNGVAMYGRLTLKGMLASGSLGVMVKNDRAQKGKKKRTSTGQVKIRTNQIIWRSFPLNFFENGRKLRNGKKEAPRKILGDKFKSVVNSQLQNWSNQAERRVLDNQFVLKRSASEKK